MSVIFKADQFEYTVSRRLLESLLSSQHPIWNDFIGNEIRLDIPNTAAFVVTMKYMETQKLPEWNIWLYMAMDYEARRFGLDDLTKHIWNALSKACYDPREFFDIVKSCDGPFRCLAIQVAIHVRSMREIPGNMSRCLTCGRKQKRNTCVFCHRIECTCHSHHTILLCIRCGKFMVTRKYAHGVTQEDLDRLIPEKRA